MRLIIGTIVFFLSLSVGLSAAADTAADINAAIFEAEAKYEFGDYAGAADAYRTAYQLSGNVDLLFEIAKCESAAKRWGPALEAYNAYLFAGDEKTTPEKREKAQAEIKIIEGKVGYLEIKAPAGMAVVVDNVDRGRTPLPDKLPVESEVEHEVKIGDTAAQRVVVGWGKTETVKPGLMEAAIDADEPEVSDAEPEEKEKKKSKSKLRTIGLITALSGGGVLLGSLVTGAVSLSYDKKLESSCVSGICDEGQSDTLNARDNLAVTTNVLLIVGATALTTGIVMMAISPGEKKKTSKSSSLESASPRRMGAKKKRSGLEISGWIAATAGGAALLASGITGGIALSDNKKLGELCHEGICEMDKEGLLNRRDLMVTTTNVLLIAGGSVLVGGIVLLALAPDEKSPVAFKGLVLPDAAFAAVEWKF